VPQERRHDKGEAQQREGVSWGHVGSILLVEKRRLQDRYRLCRRKEAISLLDSQGDWGRHLSRGLSPPVNWNNHLFSMKDASGLERAAMPLHYKRRQVRVYPEKEGGSWKKRKKKKPNKKPNTGQKKKTGVASLGMGGISRRKAMV